MELVDVRHRKFQKNGLIFKDIIKLIMGETMERKEQIIIIINNAQELRGKVLYH